MEVARDVTLSAVEHQHDRSHSISLYPFYPENSAIGIVCYSLELTVVCVVSIFLYSGPSVEQQDR